MPKVGFVNPPTELEQRYRKHTTAVLKTRHSSVRFKAGIISKRKHKTIGNRSYLNDIKTLWAALSPSDKLAWASAGAALNLSGWHCFVQDTAYRLSAGLSGSAEPSTLHTARVGHLQIDSPAAGIKLQQIHGISHKRMQKVVGTKAQFVPVDIQEILTLPLLIGVSYRANLTAAGGSPYAKFYADITSSYKGEDIHQETSLDLSLVSGWQRLEQTVSTVVGLVRSYSLVIELSGVQGSVEFDYPTATHGGTNFAYDIPCDSIERGFSNANYSLPPPWEPVNVPDGASYFSTYPIDANF